MKKVLILCTGNSCRSQMAEAALAEIGIQHTGRSKLADEFRGADIDLLVTVCETFVVSFIWRNLGITNQHHQTTLIS